MSTPLWRQTLTARIGDAGKRLHTGRSRNDQVALDIRLTLRDYSHMLQGYIVELVKVICKKAAENTTAVMPGYTHLQRAQPITFGHAPDGLCLDAPARSAAL